LKHNRPATNTISYNENNTGRYCSAAA